MIIREKMMEPVLTASPSFRPTWDGFLAEWQHQSADLPIYLVLSDLARHIAHLLEQNAESELREIFEVVEDWHLNGDAYVKEAATVGLLEDLGNTNLVGHEVPAKVVKYLRPESRRWWTKVEAFWAKGELIRDD